jgi:phage terminase Nu1 subunit (DNA packaging protein)
MLPKTVTTNELVKLSGYAKSSITELQQRGIIERVGPDTWAIETVTAIIAHLRERKPIVSNEREKFERARAQREQMKAELMAGTLCRTRDFGEAIDDVFGFLIPRLVALPARVTRDLALRKLWDKEIIALRTEVSAYCKKRAAELGDGGAAA